MSQSTLGEFMTSTTTPVEVKSLNYTDDHIDYLINNFHHEVLLEKQIEKHLEDEEEYKKSLNETYKELHGISPKDFPYPQTYLRVGNYGKDKRTN